MRNVSHDSGSGEDFDIDKTFTKGPWTSAEDDLLIAYVDKHGDGNWNAVQKHSGLSRCGKSCRLRWVNHLRPDLKKGAFTEKEEQRVIELHASMGNKWARMAAELPGRTDNEIKNFWNTRLKRLQRQGLPIYPDEVREQAMNAATLTGQNTDSLDPQLTQESLEPYNIEIPELECKFLQLKHCSTTYQSMLRSIAMGSLVRQRPPFFQPTTYNLIASPCTGKLFREPETPYPPMDQIDHLWNYPSVDNISEQFNVLPEPDSQFLGDVTYSSPSEPLFNEAEDLELPSFQCFDLQEEPEPGDWLIQQSNPISMPALESNNTLVHSPMPPLDSPSKFCDGLLESVVYGSSGEKRATNTDSDGQLFHSSLLGDTELPPVVDNPNLDDPISSDELRPSFDPDYIRRLLGADRDETK